MDTPTVDAALRLALAWGAAHYEAAYAGADPIGVTVNGERLGDAARRWGDLVAAARCLAAAQSFEGAAGTYLQAQAALGRAEAGVGGDHRTVPSVRWKTLGRAEILAELAERDLRRAAGLRLLPAPRSR